MPHYELELRKIDGRFATQTVDDYKLSFDASPGFGGENLGVSPVKTIINSLASCAAIHIIDIATKQNIDLIVKRITIKADGEESPTIISNINLHFYISSRTTEETITNILDEAMKVCPVSKMLHPDIKKTYTFEITK